MIQQVVFGFIAVVCLFALLFPHKINRNNFLLLSVLLWGVGLLLNLTTALALPLALIIICISLLYRALPERRWTSGVLLLSCLILLNTQLSTGFHSWLTIDKPFAILALAYALGDTRLSAVKIKPLAWLLLIGFPLFIALAWWALELQFQFSWDEDTAQRLVRNLLFTCIPEELLFRAWLQRGLGNRLNNHWYAIAIMSLLFGLAHIRFGTTFALVASAAGLLYGASYLLGGRLYWAVGMHFLVNACRLVLFTEVS